MEGRLKPQKESESSVPATQPDRTQEFMEAICVIGDPAMDTEEMLLFAEEAKVLDLGAEKRMILPKGSFQAGETVPYPNSIMNSKLDEREAPFSDQNTPRPHLGRIDSKALRDAVREATKAKLDEYENMRWLHPNDTNKPLKSGIEVTI
jgi:hypothetical protein